tara:strand:- start:5839 stop:6519 length:681 start_codon:yes stop_codon:yes gene_type:complete
MKKIYKNKWNESYTRYENNIFYPKEEVVKFLNRFVKNKTEKNSFKDILYNNGKKVHGLDYGCGIGRMTKLMDEFKIDAYGIDISNQAIKKAKEYYPDLKNRFKVVQGNKIPFQDSFFDISICESVIDSMHYDLAKIVLKELSRVTKKLLFISFISGDHHKFFREYSGEEIVSRDHEKGTVQSWYNWNKILNLIKDSDFKIIWARLITEESLIDQLKHGRYYIVLKK